MRLISKFMTSQPGKPTTEIQILPNISKIKSNQTIKFGQLIEYNMKNLFFKKIIQKMWWRNYSHILFQKIRIEHPWINSLKFYTVFFFIVWQIDGCRNILKVSCRSFAFTSYKDFLKNKEVRN